MALAENRKVYHDYEILESMEAGLVLFGFEAKAISSGKAALAGSRVIIRGDEAFIIGMHIAPYQPANTPKTYDPDRIRKLLLHKKEIAHLAGSEHSKGLTIVPIKLYNKSHKIKIEIAVVRGKKKYDKRESIKKRESTRRMERNLKNY